MGQFEFFPQIFADQNADFAEIISVYLRKHLRYQRERILIFKMSHYLKWNSLPDDQFFGYSIILNQVQAGEETGQFYFKRVVPYLLCPYDLPCYVHYPDHHSVLKISYDKYFISSRVWKYGKIVF